jgi:hypothetical protein
MIILLIALLFFVAGSYAWLLSRVRATERRCQRNVGEVLTALAGLREQLAVASALRAVPPAIPAAIKVAAVPRRVVPITHDDDPIHTRPTVEVKKAEVPAERERESADELTQVLTRSEKPTLVGVVPPVGDPEGDPDAADAWEVPGRTAGLFPALREPEKPRR